VVEAIPRRHARRRFGFLRHLGLQQHRIDRGKGRMHRLHFFKDYSELLRDNRR
jgi:hypothetical protein